MDIRVCVCLFFVCAFFVWAFLFFFMQQGSILCPCSPSPVTSQLHHATLSLSCGERARLGVHGVPPPPSPRTRTHCGDVLMRGTCRWCSSYRIDDHRGYETVTKHQASQLVFKCPRFPSFSLSVSLSVFSLFFLVLYPEVVTFDRLRTSPQNWYNSKKTSVIGKY